VPYAWIKYLHIASAIGLAAVHGASMVVLYMIRGERDRRRVESMIGFSTRTATATYTALAAVVGTGLWLGIEVTAYFRQAWYWLSLVLLVATTVLMWFVAKPHGARIRAACAMRPSGVPRVSDEELALILQSRRTHVVTAIGVVGLGAVLYMMVFRPGF
jgi:hypothetical protein